MGVLDGIRVLDLSIGQMGPAATALLAAFGAEVIKLESRRGDPGRGVEIQPDGRSAFFVTHNRGKKSVALNLRHSAGREVALRLAERSDVFVQSWTPGTVERLGLDYPRVAARKPDIIYASATGFGLSGPRAALPAMDMVAQGAGGLMMANAGGEGEPVATGPTVADQTGAFLLALGIMLALFHRQRTGQGQHVDASLLGGMVALQGWHIAHYLMTGQMALMSSHRTRRSPLFTFYRASDGWFTIAIIDPRQWPELCRIVGAPGLAEDPRFAETAARNQHAAELIALLDGLFAQQPRGHWLPLLPRVVGLGRAAEILMTGETVTAAEAERIGLVNRVVAVLIHGGAGYMMEHDIQRFYRDCMVLEIGEGTSHIQRNTIARQLGL